MSTENQEEAYEQITRATGTVIAFEEIHVTQTPTYLREGVPVADMITAVVAAMGANVAELGQARGLPAQKISVDRRLATLTVNSAMMHYMNGNMIEGGEIQVPVNGVFETRDGKFLIFNGAYPHLRDGILNYFGAVNNQESLNKQVKLFDSEQIQADFERLGLCCAPMMSYEEWLQHPQGKLLAQMPVIDIRRHGDGSGRRVLPPARYRPLEGVRVIDITHVVAGPWGTRLLADQGADVISIRNPHFPFLYPMIFEESYGKKQIFLDFRRKEEKDRLIELIRTADVLFWGYHAPALDRLGLSAEQLQKLNPDLILARNTGYGLEGPWANRKGWEQLAQTCSGAMEIASRGRKNKHLIASLPSDYGSGYLSATGVMSALRQRQSKGGGFYTVNTNLCKTIMLALALAPEAEIAKPVTVEDMKSYLVDQTWDGKTTYSRIKPAAELSVTPFFCATPPSVVGSLDAFRTGWDNTPPRKIVPGHKPSEYAAQGLLRSVLPGFGHEDWMLNVLNISGPRIAA